MYTVIYYNVNSDANRIKFDNYDAAKTQYFLLKDKYQYCGIIDEQYGRIIVGKLLDEYL